MKNKSMASLLLHLVLLLLVLSIWTGCAKKPILDGLTPDSGQPGTVVDVQGRNLFLASVRWDANTPSEQTVPSNFLSSRFFTVPLAASTGDHSVRLFGDGQYSDNSVNFTVTAGVVRPEPRLDDVTVSLFNIDSANRASMVLMAHGANFDVGAKIRTNGVAQPAFFSRLLRNQNMNAADPSTLGYPVFHYATVWCVLSDQPPGTDVTVSVENLDGAVSNNLTYRIAATMAELDSDGDGLSDEWETKGYDADGDGTVDVDLPVLGANPLRKDMFIEVDWMSAAAPNPAIWAAVTDAFENAPILNSDGSQGIAAHIDRGAGTGGGGGDLISYADAIRYDNLSPIAGLTYTNFYTVKQNNFDADRLNIYRYCVFAWDSGHSTGSSGRAEAILANDFFVSLGSWGADGQRADFQTGTFMHDLGHTLNLRHGGFENTNSKDNYNSIMQYGNDWTTCNGQNNKFSPSQFGGIDVDCNMLDCDAVYTYSQGQRADLDENNLDENVGVCDNVSRDWNGNGSVEAGVSVNLDASGALTVIRDYADWANIELDFRSSGSGWNNN
jgi:hypothetical protein